MYEAFFGLKRRPFAATPDSQCFLASGTIQAALDEIVVCAEQGQGIAVVTAPAGTGKTLLCERLRSELGDRFESVLLRHSSFLTRRALLQTVLCELNHSYRQQDEQELRLELSPAIRALRPQREALVLICDEAHQLSEDLLEELRILSDLADHGRPLVRLVLVGQLGLEETLALPSLEALSQRIRAHVCLETLNRAGSLDYIDYRLTWAGGRTDEIFTAEALELVSRAADGIPRCLNQLCDHALLLAYVAEQQPVPAKMIREALHDLRQLPLHWNESSLTEPAQREANSFETEPEFEDESLTRTLGASGSVASFDHSEESTFEMETIEIGADLPQASYPQAEATVESSDFDANATSSIVVPPSEPTDANATRMVLDVNHEGVRGETMIETPSFWNFGAETSAIVSAEPMTCTPRRSQSSGRFVEEFVVDRYAAIDAGLEPCQLVAPDTATSPEVHPTANPAAQTTIETVTLGMENASISISPEAESTVGAEPSVPPEPTSESVTSEPGELRTNTDFDEVCDRLDELLPHVADEASWDSATLHTEKSNVNSPMSAVMEATEAVIETHSIEDQLGSDVCQLADQLQQTLNLPQRENSPVEQLRSLLSPVSEKEAPALNSGELDANSAVESNSKTTIDTSLTTIGPASSVPGTARPYRNLFSMLRRKQQGLL